ncbi:MAG: peptidylprolyl isomerase, partial [Bacteroidales bacterium]|nr:peptidylprolyl isomerase [Bacteroidales bacterium]
MSRFLKFVTVAALAVISTAVQAQKYTGVVDKVAGVVGNEMIKLSELESQVRTQRVQGYTSDRNIRCEMLEQMLESKIFLMQARVDSLELNQEMVNAELNNRLDQVRTTLGGDAAVEKEFYMPMYKLRQMWRKQLEELSLTQQEQGKIAENIDQITPYDVKQYLDTVDVSSLPMIPTKYQMSQICVYPDRNAAAMAVKERLLSIRERIINGERFATLARLYSEDPGSARRGGELGMASKSIFWPAFSDAAMSLKPGLVSQIVETPDGFHIIEVIEKDGDMFNARHILLKPNYTSEDREKAFARLDSLRNSIVTDSVIT